MPKPPPAISCASAKPDQFNRQHLRVVVPPRDPDGDNVSLLGVDVPDRSATWVTPGQGYNKGSYWRVYRTRVRYRTVVGKEGSFGIFSLISWRGQWYVVHLGPINRTPGTGAITP